jgi:hypothetical protein
MARNGLVVAIMGDLTTGETERCRHAAEAEPEPLHGVAEIRVAEVDIRQALEPKRAELDAIGPFQGIAIVGNVETSKGVASLRSGMKDFRLSRTGLRSTRLGRPPSKVISTSRPSMGCALMMRGNGAPIRILSSLIEPRFPTKKSALCALIYLMSSKARREDDQTPIRPNAGIFTPGLITSSPATSPKRCSSTPLLTPTDNPASP